MEHKLQTRIQYLFTIFCTVFSLREYNQNTVFPMFSSVAQLCPTLCDPTNRSTPGLHVHHQCPEFTQTHVTFGEGNGTPLQYSCLENSMDGGAWWVAVHGVAKSRTQLSVSTFMHWRRKRQTTPVFLPGESQGRGSLVGCRLWGRTESDTTEGT